MYPVSAAYKAASRMQIREAQAHARIYMGVFDSTASADATLAFPSKTAYATPANVNADAAITTSYATLEPDRLRLDGKHLLLPDATSSYVAQGYISADRSGTDGAFTSPPEIVISFGAQHTLVGLTLTFDPVDPPPAQLTLLAYTGDTLVSTTATTTIANPMRWELLLTDIDKLILRFDATAQPQGRARLNHIEFGIGYSYSDRAIIDLTEKHTDAPVSTTLPSSSLTFTLDNTDGRYTLDGDTALVRFLTAGQQVEVTYGMDVSGDIEWIPGGIWQLDSWDIAGIQAKFSCTDAIAALTKTSFEKGVYDWKLHFLSDLAVAVLSDAGITNYYIDPYLQTQYTHAPIPIVSHAEALQLIANRGQARLFVDRTGRVCLETVTANPEYQLSAQSVSSRYTYYSDIYSVLAETGKAYTTFERNYARLDGTMYLLPAGEDVVPDSGMTSKGLSAADGSFAAADMLIWYAIAKIPTNAYSITLDFGGQIPDTILLYARIDGRWVSPITCHPTQQRETFYPCWEHVTAIQATITAMPDADQRAHILGFAAQNYTDFVLDSNQIFDRPTGKLLTRLRNVTAQWIWRSYYPSVDVDVVSAKATTNQGWMRLEHDCCYSPTATVDNADVTVEQTHYAYVSYVRLTSAAEAEVNLKITGEKLCEVSHPITSAGYDTGEDLPVDSALYDGIEAQTALDWMRDYYSRRVEYQASCRGFPEIDLADVITIDGDGSTAQIVASELTYNGAFRQTLTYRK